MEQKLELKQTFALSEKMMQSLRILQMNPHDLYDYLEAVSLSNPVIETEYGEGYRSFSDVSKTGETELYEKADDTETLKEFLLKQWTLPLTPAEHMILTYILNSLDDRGYFTEPLNITAAVLNTSEKSVRSVLNHIRELDPAGAAAKDLRECLLIQADRLYKDEKLNELIRSHLELVAKNHIRQIADVLDITAETAQEMCDRIRQMNPLPGKGFASGEKFSAVIPDVIVSPETGLPVLNEQYEIHISVNPQYAEMLKTADDDTRAYLEKKIKQTESIRECLQKRNQTLLKICASVLEHQKLFFEADDTVPARMRMKETAEEAGMHPSTVSRAVQGKYLECRKGIFPLRAFFTAGGKEKMSRRYIEERIRSLIEAEDPHSPFSDQTICRRLAESGINISRRTAAKYRSEMGFKDSEGRRSL